MKRRRRQRHSASLLCLHPSLVVLVVYAIGFAFATAAAGISEALPLWLSLLIVTGLILLLAAIAGLLAARFAKKASPPKPAQAIEEAERTVETLRSHV